MEPEKPIDPNQSEGPIFNVMPQAGQKYTPPPTPTRPPQPPAPKPGIIPSAPLPPPPPPMSQRVQVNAPSSHKWLYIIVGIIMLLLAAGVAYYLLGGKKSEQVEQVDVTKLPKPWLTQYFNSEVCNNQNCRDSVDVDSDGLTNYEEFKANTNPLNPDSDSDGLADGDEVKIYGTEPMLKYTDRREIVVTNDWTDGYQVKNGYDPLTPGVKFTDSRKEKIQTDIQQFKLHEPSISTTTPVPTQ